MSEKESEKEKENKSKSENRYLTRMLILVSAAYEILSIPYRLYEIIRSIPSVAVIYDMTKLYWRLRHLVFFFAGLELWHMNYAVNFYLYFVGGGRKYRQDAKNILTFCLKR